MAWERWQMPLARGEGALQEAARGFTDRGRKALDAQRRAQPARLAMSGSVYFIFLIGGLALCMISGT